MLRRSKIFDLLPPGSRILADGGFRGDVRVIVPYGEGQIRGLAEELHNKRLCHLRRSTKRGETLVLRS